MEKFTKLTTTAIPLPIENIDTDQIIPARFLKATDKKGFGDNVFRDWRYDTEDGSLIKGFPLNMPQYKNAQILVAGDNFGCGSSREHAAWAIVGFGIKVVISSFFADIFKGNALNNGLLPIQVTPEFLKQLLDTVQENPDTQITIDLKNQVVEFAGVHAECHTDPVEVQGRSTKADFDIDPYKKVCMINGYDDIDFLVSKKEAIEAFEKERVVFGR
ncbi:3-isopropylmalate dehydratase small subunit [uncultured Dokdonia sp.]|uniref:3-isopropylmalate dehydratase small subunit n=1 Tax=uncultured Dokdonia sp. TaxID=575653 RepID=UPI0026327571|nr:3-isopropylmalate dehydratase small subunit [uncultured Dokdonia sp.]